MAVAHSSSSESHTGTTGSVSQAAFTWTHTQTGTPQGVLVFVHVTNNATDTVTSVTYGSTTLTRVTGGAAVDTAGEPGRTDLFFAGSGLPTGNQTVTVNRLNNTRIMYATAVTVTAATSTNVTGIVLLQQDGTLAQQNVDDGSPGTNSVRYAGLFSGLNAVPTAGANSTLLQSIDLGNQVCVLVRETTAGQGSRPVGFSSGTTSGRAAVHVAVRELFNRSMTQTVGAFTLTGNAATLTKVSPKVMEGGRGAFTLTGNAATLKHNPKIDAETGSFTLDGKVVTLKHNVNLSAEKGTFALVGNNATLTKAAAPKILIAGLGSFTFTGNPAGLSVGHHLDPIKGVFTLIGNPAALTETSAKEILPIVGTFNLSGNNVTLTQAYKFTGATGSFALTGNPANLLYKALLTAEKGTFSLTGNPVALAISPAFIAERGAFTLTGNAVGLARTNAIVVNVGEFSVTGPSVGLEYEQRKRVVFIF